MGGDLIRNGALASSMSFSLLSPPPWLVIRRHRRKCRLDFYRTEPALGSLGLAACRNGVGIFSGTVPVKISG